MMDTKDKDMKMFESLLFGSTGDKKLGISWKKGVLTRFYLDTPAKTDTTSAADLKAQQQMAMLLKGANYKTIYKLPGKITSVSNKNALISADGRQVIQQINLDQLKSGEVTLENTIKYSKKK